MNETDYKVALSNTLHRLAEIQQERERLDVEASKLRQFFAATLNMLPDENRQSYIEAFAEADKAFANRETGLKDAIRNILKKARPRYLTAVMVRDHLQQSGFDFSGYTSNALASVSTTLRRLKAEEAEVTSIEGVTAWRARNTWISRAARYNKRKK
jgi:hypothetical protein